MSSVHEFYWTSFLRAYTECVLYVRFPWISCRVLDASVSCELIRIEVRYFTVRISSRLRGALHAYIYAAGQSARHVGRRKRIFVILAAVSVSVLGFNSVEALIANKRDNSQAGTKIRNSSRGVVFFLSR